MILNLASVAILTLTTIKHQTKREEALKKVDEIELIVAVNYVNKH